MRRSVPTRSLNSLGPAGWPREPVGSDAWARKARAKLIRCARALRFYDLADELAHHVLLKRLELGPTKQTPDQAIINAMRDYYGRRDSYSRAVRAPERLYHKNSNRPEYDVTVPFDEFPGDFERMIEPLDEREKKILRMFFVQGIDVIDIAKAMCLGRGQIDRLRRRALAKLKNMK